MQGRFPLAPRSGNRLISAAEMDHESMLLHAPVVGVAGFEPAASSSRSQVAARTASIAACLTSERPSMGVRWCLPREPVIVTHSVTRSRARARLERVTYFLRRKSRYPMGPASSQVTGGFGRPGLARDYE